MKVSVVIPVYNERAFIEEVLLRVQAAPIDKEIIVIDDAFPRDETAVLAQVREIRLIRHAENRGFPSCVPK